MSERKSKGGENAASTPHELAFKQFSPYPDTARDFMQLHLPPDLQAVYDLNTLKLESGRVPVSSKCLLRRSMTPYLFREDLPHL
nr:Rpn family recombination-promoting nuclease/putative transposase [Erwinia sp. Ejp 556]